MASIDTSHRYDNSGPSYNPNHQPEWDVAALDSTSLKNLTQDEKVTLVRTSMEDILTTDLKRSRLVTKL